MTATWIISVFFLALGIALLFGKKVEMDAIGRVLQDDNYAL